MTTTFWNALLKPNRKNLFKVNVGGVSELMAKTATKPTFSVNTHEHNFFNHKFYYPGIVTWEPVEITFVEGDGNDTVVKAVHGLLEDLGYDIPDGTPTFDGALNKDSSKDDWTITQLNVDGTDQSTWTLANAWVESANFGDFSYEDDGISEVTLTVRYDYATLGAAGAVEGLGAEIL
jgi:hypothetical protein